MSHTLATRFDASVVVVDLMGCSMVDADNWRWPINNADITLLLVFGNNKWETKLPILSKHLLNELKKCALSLFS